MLSEHKNEQSREAKPNQQETIMDVKVVPFRGLLVPDVLRAQIIAGNQAAFGWTAAMTEADFTNPQSEYYVMLEARDQLLAYVSLHHIFDEATINTVYVEPAWRQVGLGARLMDFVLEQLAARDILNLFLEVRALNVPARALYKRAGFEELVVRKGYYHDPADDAVIMQKRLEPIALDEAPADKDRQGGMDDESDFSH